jgi:hypothetical protein
LDNPAICALNSTTSSQTRVTSSVSVSYIGSNNSFRRLPLSNLSKITEAPEDLSFSFKHGDVALQTINEDYRRQGHEDYLRLPSGSFHTSQYSIKNSWEESALRCQNATIRSELDLSQIQVCLIFWAKLILAYIYKDSLMRFQKSYFNYG